MVILITGASHTGKTLLAQKMVEIYKFSSFSIDHLKMGLIRSKNTNLTPNDDEALTPYLWQIVREIIKTAIENGQNLIIEGCYVPFFWRSDFSEKYLCQIRFIALAMSDKFIDENFDKIKKHSCDIENRLDDTTCTKENLKADNQNFINGFAKNGEQIVLINDDYEKTINLFLKNFKL